jgi:hypothetical protein
MRVAPRLQQRALIHEASRNSLIHSHFTLDSSKHFPILSPLDHGHDWQRHSRMPARRRVRLRKAEAVRCRAVPAPESPQMGGRAG